MKKKIISILCVLAITLTLSTPFVAYAATHDDYGTIAVEGGNSGKFAQLCNVCCRVSSNSTSQGCPFRVHIYTCCQKYTVYAISEKYNYKPGGEIVGRYENCAGNFIGEMNTERFLDRFFRIYIENKEPEGTCQNFTARVEIIRNSSAGRPTGFSSCAISDNFVSRCEKEASSSLPNLSENSKTSTAASGVIPSFFSVGAMVAGLFI